MRKKQNYSGRWWRLPSVKLSDIHLAACGFGHIGGPEGYTDEDMYWPTASDEVADLRQVIKQLEIKERRKFDVRLLGGAA